MSSNDDQDWEDAVNLSKLQLNPAPPPQGEEEDEPTRKAPPPIVIKRIDAAEGNFIAAPARDADSPVDDSLRGALLNPRERQNVLYIEKIIFEFAQRTEPSFIVPPLANSFQRLLVYRIAQRFNIGHQTSDIYYANGERGITLFRTPSTFTPKTLLIHVLQEELDREAVAIAAIPPNVNRSAPPIENGKKVKVMKRSTSGGGIDKNDKKTGKHSETLDDKERAYEEARARIFGIDGAAVRADPLNATCTEPPQAVPNAAEVSRENDEVRNSGMSVSTTPTSEASAVQPTSVKSKEQPQQRNTSKKGRNVDTASWTGNKSIARDKYAEQSDPDFARNQRYAPPTPYAAFPNQNYGPPGQYGGGFPMGGPYGPPGEYGMPIPPASGFHDPRYGYVNNSYMPPAGFGGYPPALRNPERACYDGPYGGQATRRQPTPPFPSDSRSPPPTDNSNFPPLG